MNPDSENAASKSIFSWFWEAILVIALIGLLAAIAIPNFIGGGPNRLTSIINELRQIDAAKNEWALEHGISNATQAKTNLTEKDIAPLFVHGDNQDHIDRFGFGFDRNGYVRAGEGVVFSINPFGISPEAKLTSNFKERSWPHRWRLPKGTIIKFGKDGYEEYILPGQESKPYRWPNEAASRS